MTAATTYLHDNLNMLQSATFKLAVAMPAGSRPVMAACSAALVQPTQSLMHDFLLIVPPLMAGTCRFRSFLATLV